MTSDETAWAQRVREVLSEWRWREDDAVGFDALLAHLAAAGAKIVPVQATEEMVRNAGASPDGVSPRGGVDWLGRMLPKYYAAMLAAAPTLEARDE